MTERTKRQKKHLAKIAEKLSFSKSFIILINVTN